MSNDGKFLEELVFNKFKTESIYFSEDFEVKKKYKVIKNHMVYDPSAKKKRQVDVAIIEKKYNQEILTAIECKNHKRKVDIEMVESFITKINGIGANKGIMISTSGYTDGAISKGNKTPGVNLEFLNLEELIEYLPCDYFYFNSTCNKCNKQKSIWDHIQIQGHVNFYSFANVISKKGRYMKIYNGECDTCHTIQYLNRNCGSITPIFYFNDNDFTHYVQEREISCSDGCGLKYLINDNFQVSYEFKNKITTIFSEHNHNDFDLLN